MSDVSALPAEINRLPAALGTVASTVTAAATVIKAAPALQSGWRSCPKCRGLYFAELPDAGACAGGGKHEATRSFAYTMEFDSPAADRLQHGWRSCFKCNSLYFGPFNGVCPTGGAHDPQRGLNYAARF